MSNLNYPQVSISVNSSPRTSAPVVESTATTMFAPFISDRGPANIPTKITSYSEFVNTFGALSFEDNYQQSLNIGAFLNNGGHVWAVRMFEQNAEVYNYADALKLDSSKNTVYLYKAVNGDVYLNGLKIDQTVADLNLVNEDGTAITPTLSVNSDNEISIVTGSTRVATVNNVVVTLSEPALHAPYLYKLNDKEEVIAMFRTKYAGSYFNGLSVAITSPYTGYYTFVVKLDGTTVASISKRTSSNYASSLSSTDYIAYAYVSEIANEGTDLPSSFTTATMLEYYGEKYTANTIANAYALISDNLVYKCDLIIDAGFSKEVKYALIGMTTNGSEGVANSKFDITDGGVTYTIPAMVRGDINLILSTYVVTDKIADYFGKDTFSSLTTLALENISYYTHYAPTEDIYSSDSTGEVYAAYTLALCELLPYNDKVYGIGCGPQGNIRGVVSCFSSIDHIPTAAQKTEYKTERTNYVEADSRQMAFYLQSTLQLGDEPQQFLSVSRVVNKMISDIREIGRYSTGEFNDGTTVANLQSKYSKYLEGWVERRVLKKSYVEVYSDEWDDSIIRVTIDVTFMGIVQNVVVNINI